MHLIITDAWMAKSKAMHLSGTKLLLAGLLSALCLMLVVSWALSLGFFESCA